MSPRRPRPVVPGVGPSFGGHSGAEQAATDADMEWLYPRLWALAAGVRTETGAALDFTDRAWLQQIWDDTFPRQAIIKSTQAGITTREYFDALHATGLHGQTVIYTFPTDGDVSSFVNGRLDKIIDEAPVLQRWTRRDKSDGGPHRKKVDNVGVKRIGPGTLHIRGTQTTHGAVSTPTQRLYHDELDLSDPQVIATFRNRLDAVAPGLRAWHLFSTPTVPRFGITAAFAASDGREWLVRCAGCGWRGALNYQDHTDGERLALHCTECDHVLDPRDGAWVAARPTLTPEVHGYHVSKLMACIPERPDLLAAIHKRRLEIAEQGDLAYLFTNNELGEPSTEGSTEINPAVLEAAMFREEYPAVLAAGWDPGPFYLGCDQGDTLTVVVGRADPNRDGPGVRPVFLARLSDPSKGSGAWAALAGLMETFHIRFAVVDALPNSAPAHDFARLFAGRAVVCYYRDQRAELRANADVEAVAAGADVDATTRLEIDVDRTTSLDNLFADIGAGRIPLPSPRWGSEQQAAIADLANNVRRPEITRQGVVYRWHKTGKNDYAHALNYLRLALTESRVLQGAVPLWVASASVRAIPRSLQTRPLLPPRRIHR